MKRFLALVALVLGVVSCQTEPEGLDVNVGGEQLVTINVAVPETETRAGYGDSALGVFNNGVLDGDATMRYILQVYYKTEENGEAKYTASQERLVEYSDGRSVAFDVRLVPQRDYQFVVWADVVVNGEQDIDNHYVTKDANGVSTLNNITLNGEWNAMDESRDAFTATELIENYSGASNINITLKRPFAKLRVVTTDMKALNNLGIVPTTATVEYTETHYNAFNALYGKAINETKTRSIKHENYTIASYGEDVANGADMTLFSDYFFAEDNVTKFEFKVYDQNGDLINENTFNTDIYVKRNYLTTIKGTILTDDKNFDVTIDDAFAGEIGKEDGKTFANVDTAEELLDAINKGVENITLDGDIDLGSLTTRSAASDVLTVAADKNITLDLNGKTISYTKECDGSYAMIENKGTLTINDSKGNGKISFKDTSAGDPTFGWGSYTLRNEGTLVVENGTIEHLGEQNDATGVKHMYCAIFQYSGSTTINGGTISTPTYRSVRLWKGNMTINGGNLNGQVWVQAVDNSSNLTINGGTFAPCGADGSSIFITNGDYEVQFAVTGGFFNTKIGCTDATKAGAKGCIVGGTFTASAIENTNAALIAPGYKAEQENGVYIVRKPQALIDFENAIANGNDVTLSEDLTLIDPVVVAEGKEVTINLNGKTLDIYTHKNVGGVLTNNGTLAIEGGVISSKANNGGSAIANNGTLTVKNATLNGAPNADGSWPSYTVNNTGTMTLENSTITSKHGSVSSYGEGAVLTLNNCTIDMAGIPGFTSHGIYTYNGGKVIVNGGTYENKATDQNGTGASVINGNVEVNAGTFTGRIENYYGTPVLKGGTYSVKPKDAFVAEGYKVIEENGKYNVVLDAVDDVVTSTETLEEAIAAGSDTIALNTGEYDATQITGIAGKTISFVGNGEDTVFDYSSQGYNSYVSGGNGDFTFENMTINRSTQTFAGMAHTNSTVYKNCVINGVYFVYEKNAQFIDCTFNVTGNNYNCWLYGTEKVTYTNCTFNCDGKSIYVDGNGDTGSDAEFNNCVFNDINKVVTDKAAVETGTTYGKRYTLVFNNAKVNGFNINPNGFVTGTTLWANKHSMPASKLKVTVDGKNAYAVAADDAESFVNAIAAGAENVALTAGNYTMPEPELRGKTLTITGTRDVVIDATAVDARDQFVTGATVVFDGVTINFGTVNYMGFANTASLTYKNCKINGLQFLFGENVTFENCEFDSNGAEHSVWTYGCKNVSFTECDFTYGDRCVNCYSDNDVAGGQSVNFTKCTFTTTNTASEGAVEINSCFIKDGIAVTLDGCTAPAYGELAYVSPWDSTNGANTTIDIK